MTLLIIVLIIVTHILGVLEWAGEKVSFFAVKYRVPGDAIIMVLRSSIIVDVDGGAILMLRSSAGSPVCDDNSNAVNRVRYCCAYEYTDGGGLIFSRHVAHSTNRTTNHKTSTRLMRYSVLYSLRSL